jgi:hypothetical protein
MATAFMGEAARTTTATGQMKSATDYYSGLFKAIKAHRGGTEAGQPYTREQWSAMRAPGTALNIQLSTWMNPDEIDQFFTWAEAQAATDPTGTKLFTGSQQQLQQVRGGQKGSLATEVQKTQTKQAQSDLAAFNRNAGSMITQQQSNQSLIGLQQEANKYLSGMYSIMSHIPGSVQGGLGGALTNLFAGNLPAAGMSIFNSIFGDYGYGDVGDSGLSQLNPDLRGRLGAMMQANPNLRINSGFRTANGQQRLWESGNPNIAPPGKSRHTRGQAADLGPRSQMGWLNANAKRFGLDTGSDKGEPWHVQVAGTMIGDVGTSEQAMQTFTQQGQQLGVSLISAVSAALQAKLAQAKSGTTGTGTGTGAGTGGGTGTQTAGGTTGTGSASGAPTGTPTTGKVDVKTVLQALYSAGFRGQDLIDLAAIPARESRYVTDTLNPNRATGDDSYGLWQINVLPGANGPLFDKMFPGQDPSILYDPYTSAKMAFAMYQSSGLGPWGPYKGVSALAGVPQDAVSTAQDTAKQLWPQGYGDYGYGGAGGGGGGGGGGSASIHAPMNVTNHFAITVNGNNGVDVNNLTRQIAMKLEPQMRRMQMARR